MTVVQGQTPRTPIERAEQADDTRANRLLFPLDRIDLAGRRLSRADIEQWNPHRGAMALLDWVVWESDDHTRGVGLKHVRNDEFWVPGHFPAKALFPGVLMVEAGAQLACYLYNVRQPRTRVVAFLRIDECAFRNKVVPGDDLYLLCLEVKCGRRRFISDIQGVVNGQIAFDARISGMSMDSPA